MVRLSLAPDVLMTPNEILIAQERGRLLAAEAIRVNPDSRTRMEKKYGIKFCRERYPEAYRPTGG